MIFCMAMLEMAGVASIMPFMALLANPSVVETNAYLSAAYRFLGFATSQAFLLFVGCVVLILFVGSLTFKALNIYAINRFAAMRAHSFSYRLLEGYLHKPYSFFLGRNTADLNKTIFSEVGEIINGALIPALKVISGGFVATLIILLLFVVDPVLTMIVGLVLGGAFTGVYVVSRNFLRRLGEEQVLVNKQRFILASEALDGIKELRLMGREQNYLKRFAKASKRYAVCQASSKAVGDIPHYAIQAIAFGGILVMILFLMSRYGSLQGALPVIALYVFAGYRMMPALQELFKNVTQLRYYVAMLNSLHADLSSMQVPDKAAAAAIEAEGAAPLGGELRLEHVSFAYPGAESEAIRDLSLVIGRGNSVAFVGATGAGKSTVVDLILGLLEPTAGRITVAGQPLSGGNLRGWQKNVGYVPQTIYLADTSVAENIAFGLFPEEIDMQAVERAARVANIHDFIVESLPEGYATSVGERGIRLSGGQRQRIGIARALYHNPEVVVFDEATSALDNATEASVMEAIDSLKGEKTLLLIAHRLTTVQRCDRIFLLEQGRLCAAGSYDELLADSEAFNRMVKGITEKEN
ncbi:MAG: ATP-binding cassette domain-containing protein [Deltaproteobacteria bacterium]|nr:MAG: ATP-binding cassette domain-containing protein [Deltaproteobacteria bacterium]